MRLAGRGRGVTQIPTEISPAFFGKTSKFRDFRRFLAFFGVLGVPLKVAKTSRGRGNRKSTIFLIHFFTYFKILKKCTYFFFQKIFFMICARNVDSSILHRDFYLDYFSFLRILLGRVLGPPGDSAFFLFTF